MNTQKRIVLLNGPPRCGKDTAASHLVPYMQFQKMKFAAPLKRAVCGLLDMSESALENHKDEPFNILSRETQVPIDDYGGTKLEYSEKETPRRLLIDLSESFLKVKYGNSFFGRVAVREINRSAHSLIIFTDSGFIDETSVIIKQYRKENVLLIRLHREGCDFKSDSRSYLDNIAGYNVDIDNNGPLSHLTGKVARAITRSFGIVPSKEIELT